MPSYLIGSNWILLCAYNQAIKKYYLSTDLKGSSVQIDNIISQTTHEGGFHILVVGSFIMPDTVKRRFYQSFVLAPQGNGGYYIMNDILQYFPAEPGNGLVSAFSTVPSIALLTFQCFEQKHLLSRRARTLSRTTQGLSRRAWTGSFHFQII